MSTGSIQNASKTISRYYETYLLYLTLTNGQVDKLINGQEVYISGNNSVTKRTTGTQFPIGVVSVGSVDHRTTVTVSTCLQRDLYCTAKGGTLAAGTFVKPNGNIAADGTPEYVATIAGDYASGIVLAGGAVDTEIRVGILRSPFRIPA